MQQRLEPRHVQVAILLATGMSQSEAARTIGLTRQRISAITSRLRARFPEPIACSSCDYSGPIVGDQHPLSLMWQEFGLKLTDVTRAFGASNQRMYQLYAKGDSHGRVLSAIRRAAISKGYSATDVDERLAAIRRDRPSIIEHVLSAHRDDLRCAVENLRGLLGDMSVL